MTWEGIKYYSFGGRTTERKHSGRKRGTKVKKIVRGIILICMIVGCAGIFPLCLVRKDTNVDAVQNAAYITSEEEFRSVKQIFEAQTGYLSRIAFDLDFSGGEPAGDGITFCLWEEGKGKVLVEKYIPMEDVKVSEYTYVTVGKFLKKGEAYSYTVTLDSGDSAGFRVVYTADAEGAPGSRALYLDGEVADGQAVTRYVYGFPLNYKNVICLWGFVLMTGFLLLETVAGGLFTENRLAARLEGLLVKWQYPVLALELAAVVLLIVRISRNEAVHWDEAFSWQIVTKNSLGGMLRATAADVHPPLYYMLLMAAVNLFGKNIFVAKMVSVAGG